MPITTNRGILMGFETQDVERKTITIMKILRDSPELLEAGIEAENHGMSTVMEYQRLIQFKEL